MIILLVLVLGTLLVCGLLWAIGRLDLPEPWDVLLLGGILLAVILLLAQVLADIP